MTIPTAIYRPVSPGKRRRSGRALMRSLLGVLWLIPTVVVAQVAFEVRPVGLYDAAYTDAEGKQRSSLLEMRGTGFFTGASQEYGATGEGLGQTFWLAHTDGRFTSIGFYDAGYRDALGRSSSSATGLTASGYVAGASARYNGAGANVGQAAWVASAAGTVRVGLTDADHTRPGDLTQFSLVTHLNESGVAAGYSDIYTGAFPGQSAWVYNAATGTQHTVGFYGGSFSPSEGGQVSAVEYLSASGHLAGYSYRWDPGAFSQLTWVATADGATVRTGLSDALHTGPGGMQISEVRGINAHGVSIGESYRATEFEDLGESIWVASASGVTTAIGLYSGEHARGDYSFNRVGTGALTDSGLIIGEADRFEGGGALVGTSAWVAEAATGQSHRIGLYEAGALPLGVEEVVSPYDVSESGFIIGQTTLRAGATKIATQAWMSQKDGGSYATHRIGLYDAPEFRNASNESFTTAELLSEGGTAAGFSLRFSAGAANGQSAWVSRLGGAGVETVEIGLGITPGEHAEFAQAPGYRYNSPEYITASGLVYGWAERTTNTNSEPNHGAWVYRQGATERLGLIDPLHTGAGELRHTSISHVVEQYAAGYSERYNGGSLSLGRTAWVYDAVSGLTTPIVLSLGPDLQAFTSVSLLLENGLAAGYYTLYDQGDTFTRAFAWLPELGAYDITSLMTDQTFDFLLNVSGASLDGFFAGLGAPLAGPGSQWVYLAEVTTIPEPSSLLLLAAVALFLLAVRARRRGALRFLPLVVVPWFLAGPMAQAQTPYDQWAERHGLSGADAAPKANPDGDRFVNALEYTFGTNPTDPNLGEERAPHIRHDGRATHFVYPVSKESRGGVTVRVLKSTDLKNWTPADGIATPVQQSSGDTLYQHPVNASGDVYYALEVTVNSQGVPETVTIGSNVGKDYWEGLPPVDSIIPTQPPSTGVDPENPSVAVPNTSKYPVAVGASQGAFTQELLAEFGEGSGKRPPLRSWMGWFLWGNGTPPPGLNPGPQTSKEGYGEFVSGTEWDFFNFQWEKGKKADTGKWRPIRVDQQPLFLTPITLHYSWAPGLFGYESQPLKHFPQNAHYWQDRKIVRGVNLSPTIPFFYQYGDKLADGITSVPEKWHQAWMYLSMRPLETTVIVPSNLKPAELLQNGAWNKRADGENDPFPYPVWDTQLPASAQTPFAILTDRVGDWDADIIWEATNPRATDTYERDRYQRTAFEEDGKGNYLKMTVAQGSPFVWCETNNNRYAIFYNLIRTNLPGQIDNNTGTNAGVLAGGPWDVPGVTGVQYILLYGDHVNPNQWYQEAEPWYFDAPAPPGKPTPGGFNQPPGDGNKGQHNHTYTAVFFRKESVKPVTIGQGGGSNNNGTDNHGNPYFYLEFNEPDKNWFVVGVVPEMRYYHSEVSQDAATLRENAARAWAGQMGRYAFNFLTGTRVNYSTQNMYLSRSQYQFSAKNPYVAAGAPNAGAMTVNPDQTVFALNPHQYQPLTLGPDQTKSTRPEVVWQPLQSGYGTDFPKPVLPNANKSDPASPSRWDYWSLRGNLKTIITSGFTVSYPFQNFLPVMPPPNYEREVEQTGISAVMITDVGEGNTDFYVAPTLKVVDHSGKGSGATIQALVNRFTGQIQQIDVVSKGSGYPDGMWVPPSDATGVEIEISSPLATNGRPARAYAQTGGGQLLAVFMLDNGAGYSPAIKASQNGVTVDAPVIVPPFKDGQLVPGLAAVIEGGAGFDFSQPIELTFYTNGTTPPTATVLQPGNLFDIKTAPGGVTVLGNFPSDGALPTATVEIPPSSTGARQAGATSMTQIPEDWMGIVTNRDPSAATAPTAHFVYEGTNYEVAIDFAPQQGVQNVYRKGGVTYPTISAPVDVVFSSGDAKARVYPLYSISRIDLAGAPAGGYTGDVQVTVTGGNFSDVSGVTIPEIDFTIDAGSGAVSVPVPPVGKRGAGLTYPIEFEIAGGRGFDAVLVPVLDPEGSLISVRILHAGSNYLTNVYAYLDDGAHRNNPDAVAAKLSVSVDPTTKAIQSINIEEGGKGYTSQLVVKLTATPPPWDVPPDFAVRDHPKGVPARFVATPSEGQVTQITAAGLPDGRVAAKYLAGSENQATARSIPASVRWASHTPFARVTGEVGGFFARPVPAKTRVDQVVYSSVISQYTTLTSKDVAPYGGAFFGISAPDGYGLGNQMQAAAKFIGDVFGYQQYVLDKESSDIPLTINPSGYALDAANRVTDTYAFPVFQQTNPFASLSGALRSTVQGMQRTVTNLFANPPSHNNPDVNSPNSWREEYFAMYDTGVGRLVINPTSTQPVWGVVSSVEKPAAIPDAENQPKTGLSKWEPGMLWSGFGVSDQWNDQHYFYGYYLGAAAQAALFDRAWEPQINGKPPVVWADATEMGTAIDQLVMTLAYDPDNAALVNAFYKHPGFTYQKLAFFDQWKGHSWATGVSPGTTVAELDYENDKFAYWRSFGTDSDKFRDENENSVFEGIQAWSSTILWGGASDRKELVDLGIYLYSTSLAAADAYFLDKNYNLANNKDLAGAPNNKHSWVPVTTTPSSAVAKNGKNDWPVNTGFVDGTPEAYYTAYPAFGGAASTGQSLIKKPENTLNNFFYAFPTGSKFIQAFPPSAWTLGMSRNPTYMQKWAGAMMREEWTQARNSALYQPANWLSMAMTSALAGVPYSPGDVPYAKEATGEEEPAVAPYVERLWSSWVTADAAPGANAALMPTYLPTSVLSFLLAFEDHGYPDWTYIAKVTDANGADDDHSIVFTATFTRDGTAPGTVETTFVAFNPGWTTRHVRFHRLNPDGTIQPTPITGEAPIVIEPKRLTTVKPAPITIE